MNAFLRNYGLILYFLLLSFGAVMAGIFIFSDHTDPRPSIEMGADAVIPYSLDITFL